MLRMSLRNRVFTGWIARLSLFGTNRALAGYSPLKLSSDFFRGALFERVSASRHDERAGANDWPGLHLFILGSERVNASRLKTLKC
jgi:hypothetical protein